MSFSDRVKDWFLLKFNISSPMEALKAFFRYFLPEKIICILFGIFGMAQFINSSSVTPSFSNYLITPVMASFALYWIMALFLRKRRRRIRQIKLRTGPKYLNLQATEQCKNMHSMADADKMNPIAIHQSYNFESDSTKMRIRRTIRSYILHWTQITVVLISAFASIFGTANDESVGVGFAVFLFFFLVLALQVPVLLLRIASGLSEALRRRRYYKRGVPDSLGLANDCAKIMNTTTSPSEFFSARSTLKSSLQYLSAARRYVWLTGSRPEDNWKKIENNTDNSIRDLAERSHEQLLLSLQITIGFSDRMKMLEDFFGEYSCYEEYLPADIMLALRDWEYELLNPLKDSEYKLDSVMDGFQFEEYIARILLKNGYDSADPTQKTGDFGADVIAVKGGVRYAVQCKLYNQPIGNKAIGEVLAGMKYYNCHVGVVATNNTFTKAAREIAERSNVLLWGRDEILAMEKITADSMGECVRQSQG